MLADYWAFIKRVVGIFPGNRTDGTTEEPVTSEEPEPLELNYAEVAEEPPLFVERPPHPSEWSESSVNWVPNIKSSTFIRISIYNQPQLLHAE